MTPIVTNSVQIRTVGGLQELHLFEHVLGSRCGFQYVTHKHGRFETTTSLDITSARGSAAGLRVSLDWLEALTGNSVKGMHRLPSE